MLPDFGEDAFVERGVAAMVSAGEEEVGAAALGFTDLHAGADAEGLGLIAGGNDGARIHRGRADGDRVSAQRRIELLFDGREIAVEIEVKPAEGVRAHALEHKANACVSRGGSARWGR